MFLCVFSYFFTVLLGLFSREKYGLWSRDASRLCGFDRRSRLPWLCGTMQSCARTPCLLMMDGEVSYGDSAFVFFEKKKEKRKNKRKKKKKKEKERKKKKKKEKEKEQVKEKNIVNIVNISSGWIWHFGLTFQSQGHLLF